MVGRNCWIAPETSETPASPAKAPEARKTNNVVRFGENPAKRPALGAWPITRISKPSFYPAISVTTVIEITGLFGYHFCSGDFGYRGNRNSRTPSWLFWLPWLFRLLIFHQDLIQIEAGARDGSTGPRAGGCWPGVCAGPRAPACSSV